MNTFIMIGFFLIGFVVGYTIYVRSKVDEEIERIKREKTYGDY